MSQFLIFFLKKGLLCWQARLFQKTEQAQRTSFVLLWDCMDGQLYICQCDYNQMGGTIQKQQFPQTTNYNILDYGYCKVWKRTDTKKETMEQYEIVIDSQKMLQSYKRMWLLRAQQESVVGVYYFSHRANKEICGFYQNGSILTERIPYRLSQFCNIPYEEILLILKQCLASFKFLYTVYGLFQVRSTMIGINLQKQIKVWHHTDFSSADPQNPHCNTLAQMIESIIESIELNAEIPFYYPKFSDFMRVNKSKITPTFDQVLSALLTYAKINRIPKRQSLTQISSFLRQAQGWEELTYNSNFLTNLSNVSQLNKTSLDKYSFKGYSELQSESSSRKTLKNTPNMNIYTQREAKQQRERSNDIKSVSKSQKSHSPSQFDRYQYSNRPIQPSLSKSPSSISRMPQIQRSNYHNRININIPIRDNSPSPFKPFTTNNIDRNIQRSPVAQSNSIYYSSAINELDYQPQRTNRLQQKIKFFHPRSQL